MLLITAFDSLRARTMPWRSPPSRVTPALSIATSEPAPMATPTSAAARAGASLTPSPAMATIRPSARSRSTTAALSCGRTSAWTSSMPSRRATASAVVRLSPVIITRRRPAAFRSRMAPAVVALTGSAMPRTPAAAPSTATKMAVAPSRRSASASASSGATSTPISLR